MAGTHVFKWVVPNLTEKEKERREQLSTNWTYMLDTALDNLNKCLWIGILEKTDQSVEHKNMRTYPEPNQEEIEKLRKLIPIDLYIYEYAKQLFDHRWDAYQKQVKQKEKKLSNNSDTAARNISLSLSNVIDGCVSTTETLLCPNDMGL